MQRYKKKTVWVRDGLTQLGDHLFSVFASMCIIAKQNVFVGVI